MSRAVLLFFILPAISMADSESDRTKSARVFATELAQVISIVVEHHIKPITREQLTAWAIEGLYASAKSEVPANLRERLKNAGKLDDAAWKNLLHDARLELTQDMNLRTPNDSDAATKAMFQKFEPPSPCSSIMRDTSVMDDLRRGIGTLIELDRSTNRIRVRTPLKKSPAYDAGIMAGDIILSIQRSSPPNDNYVSPPADTKGLALTDAATLLTADRRAYPPKIKLAIQREGHKEPIVIEVKPGPSETDTVIGVRRNRNLSFDFWLDPNKTVMYLRIGQFATVTERDMRAALAEFQKQGGKALVLDLRFCRGGYVDAAVKIAEMFLTEGDLIIRIQPRERNAIEYRARKKTIDAKSPMVCLVNPGALSAAEFLTACLQDHHRAVVIGERTAGWVSIPNAVEFKSEREDARPMIRLATAVFQRPSGTNLSRMMTSGREDEVWGVYPDPGYEIKLTPKESTELEEHLRRPEVIPRPDRPLPPIPEFRDRQLEKAVEYLRTTMK